MSRPGLPRWFWLMEKTGALTRSIDLTLAEILASGHGFVRHLLLWLPCRFRRSRVLPTIKAMTALHLGLIAHARLDCAAKTLRSLVKWLVDFGAACIEGR